MKKMNLKKLVAFGCAAAMTLSMVGCGSKADTSATDTTTKTTAEAADAGQTEEELPVYKIAIVKQLDHASLDEIANAVAAELDQLAKDNNVEIDYDIYSGQNDQTTLKQIGDQAIADGVDAIIPIATLAAQVMTVCAQDTQTPVIFAAISDPEAAERTDIDYVTGTSDDLDTVIYPLDTKFHGSNVLTNRHGSGLTRGAADTHRIHAGGDLGVDQLAEGVVVDIAVLVRGCSQGGAGAGKYGCSHKTASLLIESGRVKRGTRRRPMQGTSLRPFTQRN